MGEQSLAQARIKYIDLLRAFGIVLMIMGHIPFGEMGTGFDKWIHAFHMPMFFVISGFLYKRNSIVAIVKKKAKTLIIPYFSFGFFHIALMIIHSPQNAKKYFASLFWCNTSDQGIPISAAIWFLTALFFSELMYTIINNILLNKKALFYVIIFCISLLGMACATLFPFRLPYGFDAAMVGTGLMLSGQVIRTHFHKVLNLNITISLFLVIVFSVSSMLSSYINMRIGEYGFWPLFWVNALGLTVSFWNISKIVCDKLSEMQSVYKKINWIFCIGADSIVFLCLNQLCILLTSKALFVFINNDCTGLIGFIFKLIVLVVVIIELWFLRFVIKCTKIRFFAGI